MGKYASQYRPRGRRDLGRPRKGEFSEAGMAHRPILRNKDEKKKKTTKQSITFSVNLEVEGLDFVLYIWEISG
jgi:hypothetical protein